LVTPDTKVGPFLRPYRILEVETRLLAVVLTLCQARILATLFAASPN